MSRGSETHRFALWIALFAVALQAFWPLIASAKPEGQPSLMEVCTAAGTVLIPVGEPGKQHSDVDLKLPHCAFCSAGADHLLPPEVAPLTGRAPAVAIPVSLPSGVLFGSSAEGRIASPRGPPAQLS